MPCQPRPEAPRRLPEPVLVAGDVDPQLILAWAYDLTDRLGVAGNVGLGTPTADGHRYLETTASISLGYAITEQIGSYVEYFGLYPNDHHSDCSHNINGGFTYLIDDNFQIDARAGTGLNEEAPDFFTGVGFAWRF